MSNFSFVQLLENDLEEAEDLELLSEQELLVEWSEDEEDKNRLELEETIDFDTGRLRKQKHSTKLTESALKRMGMANAAIFESKYDQAIEILQAIIKDCPTAHEPYQTLAMVYEEKGDNNKSLMFLMVAAHLKPKDIELWKRVACLSKDLNSLSQAIYCYNKVISLDSEDQDAWWERCALLIETNQLRKAVEGFLVLLTKHPLDLSLIQELAHIYVQQGDVKSAIEMLEVAMNKNQELVTLDHINILAELYLLAKQYGKILRIIHKDAVKVLQRSNLSIMENDTETIFRNIPLDLQVKLAIAELYLGTKNAIHHLQPLFQFPVTDIPDLYLDAVEAMVFGRLYQEALPILNQLIHTMEDQKNRIRIAQCYSSMSEMEKAIDVYKDVLNENPENNDLKIVLADLYEEVDQQEEAEKLRKSAQESAVMFDNEPETLMKENAGDNLYFAPEHYEKPIVPEISVHSSPELNRQKYERAMELYDGGKVIECATLFEEFRQTAKSLVTIFQTTRDLFPANISNEELQNVTGLPALSKSTSKRKSKMKLPNLPEALGNKTDISDSDESDQNDVEKSELKIVAGLEIMEWFELNISYVMALCFASAILRNQKSLEGIVTERRAENVNWKTLSKKWTADALKTLNALAHSNIPINTDAAIDIFEKARITIGLAGGYTKSVGYEAIRSLLRRPQSENLAMLLYGTLFASGSADLAQFSQQRSQKVFTRLAVKSPKNLFILAMLGHISLISGSFMFSVLCYNEAIKIAPEHPLLLLCLGISLLHRAMQRVSENRQLETIQGISFLFKYLSVRKKSNNVEFEMEANYNIGRAYALLGLNHLAIMHFEKVLSLKDSLEDKKAQDVSMEAAYNLVILLNESGSFIKSREILQKYIVI